MSPFRLIASITILVAGSFAQQAIPSRGNLIPTLNQLVIRLLSWRNP